MTFWHLGKHFSTFRFRVMAVFVAPAILRPFRGSQGPPRPKKLIQTANKGARFTPVCPQSLLKPFKLVQLLKKIRALIPAYYPIVHTVHYTQAPPPLLKKRHKYPRHTHSQSRNNRSSHNFFPASILPSYQVGAWYGHGTGLLLRFTM